MKQRIIFISGHVGSGKTTLGEILQDKFASCARVEPDFLILVRPFEIGPKLSQLSMKNTTAIVSNFLEEKYENILVVGGIWNQEQLDYYLQTFSPDKYVVRVVWLHASKDVRHARALKRGDPGDNIEWLEKVENSLPYPTLPLKVPGGVFHQVDVDDKKPEDVLNKVWADVKEQ
ncbi:MAG: AAA family ATPase [Parcubacteria group bacterium]|nr:AAA family ATPase [Parcubacteria group bacterium]